jgi:hypothetical protein
MGDHFRRRFSRDECVRQDDEVDVKRTAEAPRQGAGKPRWRAWQSPAGTGPSQQTRGLASVITDETQSRLIETARCRSDNRRQRQAGDQDPPQEIPAYPVR